MAGNTSLATRKGPRLEELRGIEHLHRDVFEQFFLGRKFTAFEVTRVVDQNVGIANFAADRGERGGDRLLRDEIQLDDHTFTALLRDGLG